MLGEDKHVLAFLMNQTPPILPSASGHTDIHTCSSANGLAGLSVVSDMEPPGVALRVQTWSTCATWEAVVSFHFHSLMSRSRSQGSVMRQTPFWIGRVISKGKVRLITTGNHTHAK